MGLREVREAVADALNTMPETTAYPRVPAQVATPCLIVEVQDIDFRTAMQRGHDKTTLLVRALLSTVSMEGAQLARDEFLDRGGAKDVKDAIESAVALRDGTAAHDCFVSSARKFDTWEFAGVPYLGVEWIVEVYA